MMGCLKKPKPPPSPGPHHYYQYITFRGNTKFEDLEWEMNNWNLLKFQGQKNGVTEWQSHTQCVSPCPPFADASLRGHRASSKPSALPLHPLHAADSRVLRRYMPGGSSPTSWRVISTSWPVTHLAVSADEHFLCKVHLHGVGLQPGSLLLR